MKSFFLLLISLYLLGITSSAQQRIDPKGMNYVIAPKPNTIIFNDTVYKGSTQFKQLFYRTHNYELMELYQRHQSNKITGQILGVAGTIATIFGISRLSSSNTDQGVGWALLGGGFATTLAGGYLTFMGQRNLQMAVTLFNQQNSKAALGMGVSNSQVGLVYKL